MNMNPQNAIKLVGAINTFRNAHPKFASFISHFLKTGMSEGTIIEITVTRPGEESVTTNMQVQQSDIDLFTSLKDMM